jgi:hypothetical protein
MKFIRRAVHRHEKNVTLAQQLGTVVGLTRPKVQVAAAEKGN